MRDSGISDSGSSGVTTLATVIAGLLLASALMNAAGYLLNFYDRIVWFDELCHLFTFFAITAAAVLIARRRSSAVRDLGRTGFAVAAAGAGLLLGIAWEVFEYSIGILGSTRDTAIDLALDTLGALLAAAWIGNVGPVRSGGN